MADDFDSYNAPQYVDFKNIGSTDTEDIDKFFDVEFELHPSVPASTTPKAGTSKDYNSPLLEDENKENYTPKSNKLQSSKSVSYVMEHSVLADISTYQTPGTSKRKSVVTYMNGRSLLVQNYDGISLMPTPNKTHPMETRLDYVIKSPGLALRSRNVPRASEEEEEEVSNTPKPRRSTRKSKPQSQEDPEVEEQSVGKTAASSPPLAIISPPHALQPEKPREKRLGYRAMPMMAVHPAEQHAPQSSKRPATEEAMPPKAVKFMAAAEMVHHFHRDTPERFHSRPARPTLHDKMHIRKASAHANVVRGNTIPKSPFLSTKLRQQSKRPEHIPSQQEREEAELEEIKRHQVKANPLDRRVLIPPCHHKEMSTKESTKFEPFNLSQGKRKEPTPEPVFRFKASAVPRGLLSSPKGVPPRQAIPLTEAQSPALKLTAKYPKRIRVETPGNNEKEVGHFGIENIKRLTPSRVTKPVPFSFEERDRQTQQRRLELMQKQLEEEKRSREFKAHKKPTFPTTPTLPQKKRAPTTVPHTPKLSALTYGAHQQQKFKEKIAEEEQQQLAAARFRARPVLVTHKQPFRPVLPQRQLADVGELQLNTERRASERARFDEMLRLREMEVVEQKAQMKALLEEEEREKEAQLRREAEFRAQPVRYSSPPKLQASTRPLTDPQSPFFMSELRARSRN